MACDPNKNELINLDFSLINDEFSWLFNTNTPIATENGQLKLIPESSTSQFTRNIGVLDPANNRINLKVNLDVFKPQNSSHDTFCAKFEIFNGSSLIDSYMVYFENLESGQRVESNFDRVYKYSGLSGAVSLKITVTEGWQNQLFLDYLFAEDFNYCSDNVQSYFVLEEFFESVIGATSGAIQLLEWKVDDVETLTTAFFTENNSPGGNPIADWFLAKANIDGSNRVSDVADPNSFNPFVSEWGLDFDIANYYDGKPTGVTSLSDYGSGILQIGIGKPSILNGALSDQKGAFFVDIDFTKNLKIVFNVLVNQNNVNVFDSPEIYRKYTILFNASTCEQKFYYNDVLNSNELNDQIDNGFLYGITGIDTTTETVGCDETFAYNGSDGVFEFFIDLGTDLGNTGISYNAFSQPDKFEIEWNGQLFSSGYVGLNTFDQQLLNLGISPSEIKTGNPGTGIGVLSFFKNSATPSLAKVRVTAPIEGTAWTISGICPDGGVENQPPTVQISSQNPINQGVSNQFNIISADSDGTIENYTIIWGDGQSTSGTGAPPSTINHTFNSLGTKTVEITVVDDDGLTATDSIQVSVVGGNSYLLEGKYFTECGDGGMNGTLKVLSGTITIQNFYTVYGGTPAPADMSINSELLGAYDTTTLGVGEYPFTSPAPNCATGSARNELIIL